LSVDFEPWAIAPEPNRCYYSAVSFVIHLTRVAPLARGGENRLLKPLSILAVIAVLACACLGISHAQEQSGIVSGTVLTAGDGAPLPRALVTLAPVHVALSSVGQSSDNEPRFAALSQRTGNDGRYSFSGASPGRYRLLITRTGYEPRTIEIELGGSQGLRVSATLEVEPVAVVPLPQDTTAIVTGRVVDVQTSEGVANVEVTVEGFEIRAVTDAEGNYWLLHVPPGPQTLRTRRIGYAANRVAIVVPATGTLRQDLSIAASALLVEGITVTGDAVSRARGEIATATVIEVEAIRHHTASSLADVLQFVPGVEPTAPGLDDIQQISLRVAPTSGANFYGGGSTTQLGSFGTLIVLDGIPLSNNANLQSVGARVANEIVFTSSAGGGIDLRRIPAKTIERVEVIRGMPSARYGDLTQGAIIVETRAGEVDPELSLQFDERTGEAAVVAGRSFGGADHAGTLTFDYSSTRTSPGLTDDRMTRFAGQLAHRAGIGRTELGGPRLLLDTRADAYQLLDDRPEDLTTRGLSRYNRDRGFRLSERALLTLSPTGRVSFTGGLTALQQRGNSRAPLTRGPMPFTNTTTEGRAEGVFFIGHYIADVEIDGDPYLAFGRFEGDFDAGFLGFSHRLRPGLEFRREWNSGPGYQFDILYPPQVTFNGIRGFDRPRSYDDVPPLVTSAAYMDDRLTRSLGGDLLLTVQAGLRLDVLHGGSHWFSGVQDAALQPRINVELSPRRWLRFRGGWGLVAKTPSLALYAPAPQWYDVVNVNWFTDEPEERLAVITTFIEDPTNPDLGFANSRKAEAGIEVGSGSSAVSLVFFDDRIDDSFGIRGTPSYLLRDHYDLADSTRGTGVPPEIVEPASFCDTVPILIDRPDNVMTVSSKGVELTALLPEIPYLKTRLHVTGQWIETRQTTDALYYGSASKFEEFSLLQSKERTPYWEGVTAVGRRALVTYRLIHHQPELGLVLTGILQHNVTDFARDLGGTDTLAFAGYVTRAARQVPVPPSERAREEYRDLRIPRAGVYGDPQETPADWLLSVQVSKTFPMNGRLSFWAYNLLDRRGIYGTSAMAHRLYGKMRFGLELFMPVRGLLGWLY